MKYWHIRGNKDDLRCSLVSMLILHETCFNPTWIVPVRVTKLPTTFFMFTKVPSTYLDQWLALSTNFPREYTCSLTICGNLAGGDGCSRKKCFGNRQTLNGADIFLALNTALAPESSAFYKHDDLSFLVCNTTRRQKVIFANQYMKNHMYEESYDWSSQLYTQHKQLWN